MDEVKSQAELDEIYYKIAYELPNADRYKELLTQNLLGRSYSHALNTILTRVEWFTRGYSYGYDDGINQN